MTVNSTLKPPKTNTQLNTKFGSNVTNRFVGPLGKGVRQWSGSSIPGRVIPKTLKMVLYTSLLNTQQYKVRIKDKGEQSRERSSVLRYTSM